MNRVGHAGALRSIRGCEGRPQLVQSCVSVQMRIASVKPFQPTPLCTFDKEHMELRRWWTSCSGAIRLSTNRRSQQVTGRRSIQVFARRDADVEIGDRIISSLPYLIPLFDGLKYGKHNLSHPHGPKSLMIRPFLFEVLIGYCFKL